MLSRKEAKYPEHQQFVVHLGAWSLVYTALRARAIRTSGSDDVIGREARTGFYLPGDRESFRWTDTPDPPKYIKTAAAQKVRKRRGELGLPV